MQNKLHPIYCKDVKGKIYFSYYKDDKKEYFVYDTFRHYFYGSSYNTPILNKNKAQKMYSNYPKNDVDKFDFTYEADISKSTRYLLDYFGQQKVLEKHNLRIAYFDIECLIEGKITTSGEFPISAISIYDNKSQLTYSFVFDPRQQDRIDNDKKIKWYRNENEMLEGFLEFFKRGKFDILSGYNCIGFDIPYLCNRLQHFKLMNKLSPFGIVRQKYNSDEYEIIGVNIIDYMLLYKKYKSLMGINVPSLKLDNVCENELGEGKLQFDLDLNTLYRNNINKYVEYNRKDVILIAQLEKKLNYILLLDEIRRIGVINIEDAMSNSLVIDNVLVRFLNKAGYVSNTKVKNERSKFQGAYVYETISGIYDDVICLDFASLYPFIIMNFNISPETKKKVLPENMIKDYVIQKDEILAPSGVVFKKENKGIFPKLCEWLYSKRKEYQKLMLNIEDEHLQFVYNTKQQTFKILLNCFTGDHDIVTLNGIKNIKDVRMGDKVLNVNPNDFKVEVDEIIKTFEYDYEGDIYNFKDINIDFSITPNHKFLVYDKILNKNEFIYAEILYKLKDIKMIPLLLYTKDMIYFLFKKYSIFCDCFFDNKFIYINFNNFKIKFGHNIILNNVEKSKRFFKGKVYCVETKKNKTVIAGKNKIFCPIGQSFYGFVGFQGSRFFDVDLAESVTLTGQNLIKFVCSELEKLGYHISAGDTDSIFSSLADQDCYVGEIIGDN